MTLFEHLEELRTRLWRAMVAVLIFGGVSLYFARDVFWILMRPVLAALPEAQRALVYTSGIEEINVFLKVGLYAGIFLGTPVILYQVWQFVAPGLLPSERKMVGPFVMGGTAFFLGGAVFCYFLVLPAMFQILLRPAETAEVRDRVVATSGAADDAVRLLLVGRTAQASALVAGAKDRLAAPGDGRVPGGGDEPGAAEMKERLRRLGQRLDVAAAAARDGAAKDRVAQAVGLRAEADALATAGRWRESAAKADEAAGAVALALAATAGAEAGPAFRAVWDLDRQLAAGEGAVVQKEWTRPMLTMREQLSLVLFLELAFGIIFELPLIMALLAALGVLKASTLARYQRHAFVICVIAAALVTPSGDAVNLALMAAPMFVCYELGLFFAWVLGRRREARQRAEEQALAAVDK